MLAQPRAARPVHADRSQVCAFSPSPHTSDTATCTLIAHTCPRTCMETHTHGLAECDFRMSTEHLLCPVGMKGTDHFTPILNGDNLISLTEKRTDVTFCPQSWAPPRCSARVSFPQPAASSHLGRPLFPVPARAALPLPPAPGWVCIALVTAGVPGSEAGRPGGGRIPPVVACQPNLPFALPGPACPGLPTLL